MIFIGFLLDNLSSPQILRIGHLLTLIELVFTIVPVGSKSPVDKTMRSPRIEDV